MRTVTEQLHTSLCRCGRIQLKGKGNHISRDSGNGCFRILDFDLIRLHRVRVELFNFTDRTLDQEITFCGKFTRQCICTCPSVLCGREITVPHFLPCNHNDAAVRHPQCLRCIDIKTVVDLADHPHLELTCLKIQLAEHIKR